MSTASTQAGVIIEVGPRRGTSREAATEAGDGRPVAAGLRSASASSAASRNDFSSSFLLGEDGFDAVYNGFVDDAGMRPGLAAQPVTIKQLNAAGFQRLYLARCMHVCGSQAEQEQPQPLLPRTTSGLRCGD